VSALRVHFIHGLESSPQGTKARLFAEHFDAQTPAMDTGDFEACVKLQAEAVARFRPDVLVGSSFGGAVAVALLQRGLWRGPTLLLAQAALRQGLRPQLPDGVPVWLVHGVRDEVVPLADSRALARAGSPELVRLIEVDDDHALHATVRDGRLVRWVRELAGVSSRAASGLARHLATFVEEPTLWPVTGVVGAHAVLFGGVLLLFSLRDRSPPAMAALAIALAMSTHAIARDLRARRFGTAARIVAALWLLSALAAFAGARSGLL
jgi:predicted esterase